MRNKLSRTVSISLCIVFFFIMVGGAVHAVDSSDPFGLEGAASGTGVSQVSLTGENSIIATIIFNILSMVGIIFLILMIWGGIMWMTSGGNEQRVSKAKSILTTATIGLLIIVLAYSITYFVVESVTTIDKPTGQTQETP